MAYSVKKIEVWTGDISDRAGGLAAKLAALAEAKADLTFVVARRQPHQPGMGRDDWQQIRRDHCLRQ